MHVGLAAKAGCAYGSPRVEVSAPRVAKVQIGSRKEITTASPVKKPPATKQRPSKFYPPTDAVLGRGSRARKSPWLLRLLSSSILWPFTHCRSIIARYSLRGKQGNRKTADRSNCWHFSGRFLRQSVKLPALGIQWRLVRETWSTSFIFLSLCLLQISTGQLNKLFFFSAHLWWAKVW